LEPDARRQQLIAAATRVFARGGYHDTDVTAIVAEAGVARGTFYLYFPTKRDVFLAIIDQYLDLQRGQAGLSPPPPGLDLQGQLAHAFAQALRRHADHRDLALVALRDGWAVDAEIEASLRAAGDAAKASLAAAYERLMAAGQVRRCDSHLIATAVGGMLREVLLHEVLLKGRVGEIDRLAAELAALVYQGLRPAG
jgi:AcrR family transcriptional regulator